jgi:hypothetical protein
MTRKTLWLLMAVLLIFPAAGSHAAKKKKSLLLEGQEELGSYVWQKHECIVYKHAKGIGIVVAPKREEEIARVDAQFFDGVFYVAIRDKRVHKMIAVEKGRISRVTDVIKTQCIQAGKFISEEVQEELEKAYRTKHRNYFKEFVLPNKDEFRVFVFV